MPRSAGSVEARLAHLEASFHAFRAEVLRWHLDHARYHLVNEPRWGLVALMRAHPFRTLAAGAAAGAIMAVGMEAQRWWSLLLDWLR